MAAADESRDEPGAGTSVADLASSAADIRRLVSGLTVRRTDRGGLIIETPPKTAATLAALFSGMAQLLQAAAAPTAPQGDPAGRQ